MRGNDSIGARSLRLHICICTSGFQRVLRQAAMREMCTLLASEPFRLRKRRRQTTEGRRSRIENGPFQVPPDRPSANCGETVKRWSTSPRSHVPVRTCKSVRSDYGHHLGRYEGPRNSHYYPHGRPSQAILRMFAQKVRVHFLIHRAVCEGSSGISQPRQLGP